MRNVVMWTALVAAGWALSPETASACSDAGVPPCEGAGMACDDHDECGSGQTCSADGGCQCELCRFGDLCDENGCVCALPPQPPPGCEGRRTTCGEYYVECPEPDAGPPPPPPVDDPCHPDAGGETTLPDECSGGGGGGCAAGGAPSTTWAWAVVGLALWVRRLRRA